MAYDGEATKNTVLSLTYDYVNALQVIFYADLIDQFTEIKESRPPHEHRGIDFVIGQVAESVEELLEVLEHN